MIRSFVRVQKMCIGITSFGPLGRLPSVSVPSDEDAVVTLGDPVEKPHIS